MVQISKDMQLSFDGEEFSVTQNMYGDDIDVIILTVEEAEKLAFEIEQIIRVNKALGNL